jgi:malonyl-CoA O-methyltransferase
MRSDQSIVDLHKQQIAERFGQAASTYKLHAKPQYEAAQHLLNLIGSYYGLIPSGDILEIGCGTGFITQGLLQHFENRSLEITDLSSEMLNFCQHNVIISDDQIHKVSFSKFDAEMTEINTKKYASIVSGFVIQWFKNPYSSIFGIVRQLHSNGILFLSFPSNKSFPEWQKICRQLDLPFTANPLPDTELLLSQLADQVRLLHVETVETVTHHQNAADFFRGLKAIGANVSQQRLSAGQMKRLIRGWDAQALGQIDIHYHVNYLALQNL